MNTKVYPFEMVFSFLLEKENHFLHEAFLQTLVWSDGSLNIRLILQILKHLRAFCTPLTDPFELLCGCSRNTLSPSPGSFKAAPRQGHTLLYLSSCLPQADPCRAITSGYEGTHIYNLKPGRNWHYLWKRVAGSFWRHSESRGIS